MKKASTQLIEPKAVIETIVHVRYIMFLNNECTITGIITDGTMWHCLKFVSGSSVYTAEYGKVHSI